MGSSDDTATVSPKTTTTTTSATRPYKFYQGTAMGQPSVIVVDNIRLSLQSTSGTDHDDHQHHHNNNNSHTITERKDNTLNETNDTLVPEQHIAIHDTDDEYNTNSHSSAELLSSTHAAGTMQQKEPRDRNPVNTNVMATIENCETTATTETSNTATTTTMTDETGTSTSRNPTTSDSTPTDNKNKDYRYQYHRGTVSFTLLGRIEVDHTEIMEI
jgi:hypothetical protein